MASVRIASRARLRKTSTISSSKPSISNSSAAGTYATSSSVANPSCNRMSAVSSSMFRCSVKSLRMASSSAALRSSASATVMMFNCHSVRSEAKRTFCPPRPMASASWSSATTTSTACLSSSITMRVTSAGESALITNCAVSGDHNTTSIRSPDNSLLTAFTREPRTPMQVPCGSIR